MNSTKGEVDAIQRLKRQHRESLKQCKQEMYFWFQQELKRREKKEKQEKVDSSHLLSSHEDSMHALRDELEQSHALEKENIILAHKKEMENVANEHDKKVEEMATVIENTREEATRFRERLLLLGGHAQDCDLESRSLSDAAMQNIKEFEEFLAGLDAKDAEDEMEEKEIIQKVEEEIKARTRDIEENKRLTREWKAEKVAIMKDYENCKSELKHISSSLADARDDLQRSEAKHKVCAVLVMAVMVILIPALSDFGM